MWENKKLAYPLIALITIAFCVLIYYFATPNGRRDLNQRQEQFIVADNETKYETKKTVEDTARSMVASYEADKLYWEQYKDSDSKKEREWAGQSKFRANKTAVLYNEYILKNSRVWDNNIPNDIHKELEIIKE